MSNKNNKIILAIMISIVVFGGLTTKPFLGDNKYLQAAIKSIQNKDFIQASGLYGGTPPVTILVDHNTTSMFPNITGTCTVNDLLEFKIYTGPTYSVLHETLNKTCTVSPYLFNPTIPITDGKYRVDVKMYQP